MTHAATPAQLCVSGNGFQYYFIGTGGVQEGPYLPSISDLAELHSAAMAAVELYRGVNPMTGKSVQIDYLPKEQVIRVFTFYADTPYSYRQAVYLHARQKRSGDIPGLVERQFLNGSSQFSVFRGLLRTRETAF